MLKVASIDIGTNSVLLLIAERHGDGLVALEERATITRLGEAVDGTRRLLPEACQRTLDCLQQYSSVIRKHAVDTVVAVGTSAMRDAKGGSEFRSRAATILGVAPRVLSGSEEAQLTFIGALSGLAVEGPLMVCDIGGGSTEIISGQTVSGTRRILSQCSLDIGSVRLFERFLRTDPPSRDECAELEGFVRAQLDELTVPVSQETLVGVAGTVTTLAAIEQGLVSYSGELVHGTRLEKGRLDALVDRLAHLSTTERSQLPGLAPKRADVIVAGAFIVRELMNWAGAQNLLVSDRGVRWGLAEQELLGQRVFTAHGANH